MTDWTTIRYTKGLYESLSHCTHCPQLCIFFFFNGNSIFHIIIMWDVWAVFLFKCDARTPSLQSCRSPCRSVLNGITGNYSPLGVKRCFNPSHAIPSRLSIPSGLLRPFKRIAPDYVTIVSKLHLKIKLFLTASTILNIINYPLLWAHCQDCHCALIGNTSTSVHVCVGSQHFYTLSRHVVGITTESHPLIDGPHHICALRDWPGD